MSALRLLSWNVNGIRAVEKKGFLDILAQLAQQQPDILCIQETKASEDQLSEALKQVPGYRAYFCSSQEKKGYSGVALYSKIAPHSVKCGLGIQRFDVEGRTIVADYGDFVLFNIYYPHGKASPERLQYKLDFYAAFLQAADALKNAGRQVVVCGDVNTAHKEIDLARPKENEKVSGFLPIERAWMDEFTSHGYVDTLRMFNQLPQQYSWWDMKSGARARNIGWRIDYFYVSEGLRSKVTNAFILPEIQGSDHCPVGLEIAL
jgi:exodeoxyribonuclease-3